MLFRCKNCSNPVDVDFYYHTNDHKNKFMDLWQDAINRATQECGCSKNKNSKN